MPLQISDGRARAALDMLGLMLAKTSGLYTKVGRELQRHIALYQVLQQRPLPTAKEDEE